MRFSPLTVTLIAGAVASTNAQITINVGAEATSPNGGIFQFNPSTSTAPNGTVVTFLFSGIPGNHSVTQSSFDAPCEPLAGGFDSGWIGIGAATTPLPQWNVTITNDAKPIWFYCKQLLPAPHCSAGMVGGINVPTSGANTFAAFQANAKAAKSAGQAAGELVGIGASASAEPLVPSGAVFYGPGVSATAPAGGVASGSAPGSTQTQKPSSAVSMNLNTNVGLLLALVGVLAGGAMII
ncbi:hypothetical protein B0H16DRAFT_1763971 [Mycena metata]|uniref:Extracellular serine-rich protein n=1 Tax=Mycena metata TaxID=1033252 RepID=A0AAD7I6W7_9AGAR|nr:hypothetical protein B0H16DRAFT_1763971 [Mycena metata]